MKRSSATISATVCAILAVAGLAGCAGGQATSSSPASSPSAASPSAAASSSPSATSSSATATRTAADGTGSASSNSASIISIDGVDVVKIAVEMVGDTPNLQMVFSNNTSSDVEVDLSKFKVVKPDGEELSFHLAKKVVKANTPYAQNAFTASPGSLKAGDKVTLSYDGQPLGEYEVGEF